MSVETEARALGWVPQEEFRGDPNKWVDAETFIDRGRNMLPLLKKTNERLEAEVSRLKQLFEGSQEAIQELKKFQDENTARAVDLAKQKLLAELKIAREEGDVDAEIQINDQLADIREAQRTAKEKPAPQAGQGKDTPADAPADALHPDFKAWAAENPWFGTDERKTIKAMGIAQVLRADPENDGLQGRAFYDKVLEMMNGGDGRQTSKVGDSRTSGTSSPTRAGAKTFENLPADAKAACERQGKKLVGEGRAFKTMKEWQDHYVAQYYRGDE